LLSVPPNGLGPPLPNWAQATAVANVFLGLAFDSEAGLS